MHSPRRRSSSRPFRWRRCRPSRAAASTSGRPVPRGRHDAALPATIGGAGSTFAAPLQNAAQALYAGRNLNATINGYQAVGSGTGESDIIKKVRRLGRHRRAHAAKRHQQEGAFRAPTTQLSDFLQIPIGLGGVAIPYNDPGIKPRRRSP